MAVKPHAVTWNELRFYVGPRPAGGDALSDELAKLTDAGVDVVVSLLTAGENFELELTTEAAACVDAGMSFVSVPVPDREVPESDLRFIASALEVYDHLAAGRIGYMHCRAGIGRATLFACTLLVLAGVVPNDALGIKALNERK